MLAFNLKFTLAVAFLVTVIIPGIPGEKESCRAGEDGISICEETLEDEGHNVWKNAEMEGITKTVEDAAKLFSEHFSELELEVFVGFFSSLKDWTPTTDSLSNYKPEEIVAAIMHTYAVFDRNDDGLLQFEDMKEILTKRNALENLEKIAEIFEEYGGHITLFQYFNFFKKLGGTEDIAPLLTPFEKLQYMPPLAAKRIILGSVQMFKDSDVNENGNLDKEEFAIGMRKSREKQESEAKEKLPEISLEQMHGLFDVMDKDNDGLLTYREFQATMPDGNKSFADSTEEIFKEVDTNFDGQLTEEEFKVHMTGRAEMMNMQLPTDEQISTVFENLDKDDSGALSLKELQVLYEQVKTAQEKKMMEAFVSFDSDQDGFLDMDELESIVEGIEKTTGQKIDKEIFMTMLDTDKDGKVSMDEMNKVFSKMMPDSN